MVPVVAVDVDGVLAIDPALVGSEEAVRDLGYRPHLFDGPGPDGEPARGTVWLNSGHGPWLAELAEAGAELVWATSWGIRAADWIAPRLGLATDWPVLSVPAHGIRFGRSPKHAAVADWARGRPLAWLDDVYGGKDLNWAEDRRDDDELPTLLHSIDPTRGLQRADIEAVLAWMRTTVGV